MLLNGSDRVRNIITLREEILFTSFVPLRNIPKKLHIFVYQLTKVYVNRTQVEKSFSISL